MQAVHGADLNMNLRYIIREYFKFVHFYLRIYCESVRQRPRRVGKRMLEML